MAKSRSGARRGVKRRERRAKAGPRRSGRRRTGAAARPRRVERASTESGYDPRQPPAPSRWLSLTEEQRLQAVRDHHEALALARRPPSMDLHVGLHVVVETQLAAGRPPQVVAALERLLASGMRRHDAVHAIGWVAMDQMRSAAAEGRPVDPDAYAAALDGLTRESWIEAARGAMGSTKPL